MAVKHCEVYVTYFCSLKNFYVQKKKDLHIIQEISKSLQSCIENDEQSLVDIKPGDLVAAKYESDGLWYRAKVLNTEENYKVQFIDYGNSDFVISSNLRHLPVKLASYQTLAYLCKLDNIDEEDHVIITKNDIYKIIIEFITSVELNLTFLCDKEPYVVKLKWNDRNIKTFINNIISFGITPKTYETLKTHHELGANMQIVNVIYTESINEFYVDTQDSEEIKGKIEYHLENETIWTPVTDYTIGKIAIAKSLSDERWYRVRILEFHSEEKYICYLFDYGVKDVCLEFYEAVDFLEAAPPFIKRCSLHMPNIKKKKILNSLSKSFLDEMIKCKDLNMSMNMTIVKNGEPFVVDLYADNMSVAEIIKPKPVVVFRVYHLNVLTVQINTNGRQTVLKKLIDVKSLPNAKELKVGKMYAAYLVNQFYRVLLVMKYSNQLMDVRMVDMGGKKFQTQELYELPKCMTDIEYKIIHCSLGLNDKQFSVNRLRQLCNDGKTEFTMILLEENEINGHHIQLFLDDKNVEELIKND